MSYPSSIDSFVGTVAQGTTTLAGNDHALDHRQLGSASFAIETVLGTTAGTSVLKNFAAGDFPSRINSSGVLQQVVSGTVNLSAGTLSNVIVGTSQITGGTINNAVLGTPTVTLGSDAQGDLYYRSAAGTVTRLGVGTAGQYLTTNGTTPSWGTVATSSNPPCVKVYNSGSPTISNSSDTVLSWDVEEFDTDTMHGTANPTRITVNTSGKYFITAHIAWFNNSTPAGRRLIYLNKNGSNLGRSLTEVQPGTTSISLACEINTLIDLSATDYIEVFAAQTSGGDMQIFGGTEQRASYFQAVRVA